MKLRLEIIFCIVVMLFDFVFVSAHDQYRNSPFYLELNVVARVSTNPDVLYTSLSQDKLDLNYGYYIEPQFFWKLIFKHTLYHIWQDVFELPIYPRLKMWNYSIYTYYPINYDFDVDYNALYLLSFPGNLVWDDEIKQYFMYDEPFITFKQHFEQVLRRSNLVLSNMPKTHFYSDHYAVMDKSMFSIGSTSDFVSREFLTAVICSLAMSNKAQLTLGDLFRLARYYYYNSEDVSDNIPKGIILQSFSLIGNPLVKLDGVLVDLAKNKVNKLASYCMNYLHNLERGVKKVGYLNGMPIYRKDLSFEIENYSILTTNVTSSAIEIINDSNNLTYYKEVNFTENYSIITLPKGYITGLNPVFPGFTRITKFPKDAHIVNFSVNFQEPIEFQIRNLAYYDPFLEKYLHVDCNQTALISNHSFRFVVLSLLDKYYKIKFTVIPFDLVNCSLGIVRLYRKINYSIVYTTNTSLIFDDVIYDYDPTKDMIKIYYKFLPQADYINFSQYSFGLYDENNRLFKKLNVDNFAGILNVDVARFGMRKHYLDFEIRRDNFTLDSWRISFEKPLANIKFTRINSYWHDDHYTRVYSLDIQFFVNDSCKVKTSRDETTVNADSNIVHINNYEFNVSSNTKEGFYVAIICNGSGSMYKSFVIEDIAPIILSPKEVVFDENKSFSFNITLSDPDRDNVFLNYQTNYPRIMLDSSTFRFDPIEVNSTSKFYLILNASDKLKNTIIPIAIVVNNIPKPPIVHWDDCYIVSQSRANIVFSVESELPIISWHSEIGNLSCSANSCQLEVEYMKDLFDPGIYQFVISLQTNDSMWHAFDACINFTYYDKPPEIILSKNKFVLDLPGELRVNVNVFDDEGVKNVSIKSSFGKVIRLNNETWQIVFGNLSNNYVGTHTIGIEACDVEGVCNEAFFELEILPDEPPTIDFDDNLTSITVKKNQDFEFEISVIDPDSDKIYVNLSCSPRTIGYLDLDLMKYVLEANSANVGNYTCDIIARDDNNEVHKSFNIFILAICYGNKDCGGIESTGELVCIDNNVYERFLSNVCLNPGTDFAQCTVMQSTKLVQHCLYGCSSGRCIEPRCYDSDGRDYTVRGFVNVSGSIYEDFCDNENVLVEYVCENNQAVKIYKSCNCDSGACVEDIAIKDYQPKQFELNVSPYTSIRFEVDSDAEKYMWYVNDVLVSSHSNLEYEFITGSYSVKVELIKSNLIKTMNWKINVVQDEENQTLEQITDLAVVDGRIIGSSEEKVYVMFKVKNTGETIVKDIDYELDYCSYKKFSTINSIKPEKSVRLYFILDKDSSCESITFKLDPANKIQEKDESNNVFTLSVR